MLFHPTNFRTLPDELPSALRTDQGMTFISIKSDGTARYGRTVADKDAIVEEHTDGDLLLLAWTGQWRTDVFLVTKADLARHYHDRA